VVTIDPATGAVTRNVEYYVLGHASRFVLPGALRVGATTRGNGIEAAAFLNPDGSRVAILHRTAGAGPVTIAIDGARYSVPLAAGSVATLRWSKRRRAQ
jgi:glucosylceramidase